MSTLEFLSVDAATASPRFRPLARSAMERRLREAGAEFAERDGWLVATRVPGEEQRALEIRDVTHAYTVHEGETEFEFEFGRSACVHSVPSGHTFVARPRAAPRNEPEQFIDLTGAYAALEIRGPGAETLMRRLTDLELSELPAVGPIAHARAYVFRRGEEQFLIFFGQEYGHYVWEVVVDAAEPLGGGPAGAGR